MSSIFQGIDTSDDGLVAFDIGTGDVSVSNANLPGAVGDYFSTPDSVANSIRQSIVIEADLAMVDWSPTIQSTIVAKRTAAGSQTSYHLSVRPGGQLELDYWETDGTLRQLIGIITTGFVDGTRHTVSATLTNNASGQAQCVFSRDGVPYETLIGTWGAIEIADTTAVVEVGSWNAGALGNLAGTIYSAQITKGPTPYPYVLLDGVTGTYVSTPDSPANSITGSIRIDAEIEPDSWTAGTEVIVGKSVSSGGNVSYRLIRSVGTILLILSSDGTASVGATFTHGQTTGRHQLRAEWDSLAQNATLYIDDALISVEPLVLASIFDSTAPVEIGSRNAGANDIFLGRILNAQIYNGIGEDAELAVNFDPKPYLQGDPSFIAPITGETWTLQGNAIATSPIDDGVKVDFDPNAYQGGNGWFNGMLGTELIANGDFQSGIAPWVDSGGGGTITVTPNNRGLADTSPILNGGYQEFTTATGLEYLISYEGFEVGGGITPRFRAGTSPTTVEYANSVTAEGKYQLTFVSIQPAAFVVLASNPQGQVEYDNVSVRQIISGSLWTINGNASVFASTKMRNLYLNPLAQRPFPVYASEGQLPASYGGGGLSWDADSRLRITTSVPDPLTRTNALKDSDITDVANWSVDAGVGFTYEGDGWFRVQNISAGVTGAVQLVLVLAPGAGEFFYASARFRNADPVNDGLKFLAAYDVGVTTGEFDGTISDEVSLEFTGTTETSAGTGLVAFNLQASPTAPASDDFYFQFPTIEFTTTYPAGVPPIAIPVDTVDTSELYISRNAVATDGYEADSIDGFALFNIAGNTVESQSAVTNNSDFAILAESNTVPTGNARIAQDIGTEFGLVVGDHYTIYFDVRHVGTGGTWSVNLGSSSIATDHPIASLSDSDIEFEPYTLTFIYDATYQFLVMREQNGANTGGAYLDNVSIVGLTDGEVDIAAEVQLPGGIKASGPTGELLLTTDPPDVIHQGVGLTNGGYICT